MNDMSERGDVKHNDVLKKNEVQCFQACSDLILSMHGFLTQPKAAYTRLVKPMRTV